MTISERNTIFEQHRNIIYYTVHKHRSLREAMRMDFEDLAQELTFCLLDAIERYDPSRGAKDTTYYFKRLRYGLLDLWRAHIRDTTDIEINASGDMKINVGGNIEAKVKGNIDTTAAGNIKEIAARIDHN